MVVTMILPVVAGVCCFTASAVSFSAGNYYFDNSKLKFSRVKLVVGNVTSALTKVYEMAPVEGRNFWKASIDEDIINFSYF